ncbi:hypothetical protein C1645_740657 [Glomus cerebriforme]|uniref:GDP-fucose protein O-fucosyltransferase n=1 Tax=Glomus cerebriforme TaxID=658196 RepID=A0A397SKL7_9GLOM|nr:hypothetical protein C1645_740657 [Glomus cerebriforme]
MIEEIKNNNTKISQKQISLWTKKLTIIFFILVLSNLSFNLLFKQINDYKSDDETTEIQELDKIKINISSHEISHDVLINRKYCGKDECKFVLPYHPTEQESQANMHLESFVQIAQRLDRIIVLPNVGGSRMSICQPFPFSFYYDMDGLKQIFPKVQFITQEDFMNWTKELNEKPDTYHAYIIPREKPFIVEYEQPKIQSFIKKECLHQFDLNLNFTTIFKTIYLGVNVLYPSTKDNEKIENFMLDELRTDSKVLLMKHHLSTLLFANTINFPIIPYSKKLVNIQQNITKNLGNYLAIHWRFEKGKPKLMTKCSKNLIDWIKDFSKDHKIDNIYFATDYPLQGKAQSSSFFNIREEHHEAMRMLNSTIKLNTWISLNALDELKNDQDEEIKKELKGSGIQGILDKLILINADWFVSGPRGCARIQSRYTRRIRYARKKLQDSGNTKIKNISSMWNGVD